MLRDKQLKTFEERMMFEQRILNGILPRDFDRLEHLVASDLYRPPINDSIAIAFNKKRSDIVREAKRTTLNMYVEAYQTKIREYERQYRQELSRFKQEEEEVTSDMHTNASCSQNTITVYVNHRTNRIKQDVYNKMASFRKQLQRRRQRSSVSIGHTVHVCPQVMIDVDHIPLNAIELTYLSRGNLVFATREIDMYVRARFIHNHLYSSLGPGYIRPNQSSLRPYHRQLNRVKKEESDLMNKIVTFFSEKHHMPRSLSIFKEYMTQLHDCLVLRYMAPLAYADQIQARREFNLTRSIRRKFKRNKLILRQTDKSGVFHIGRASDYETKTVNYRKKTGAYEELPSNPFDEVFTRVVHFLHQLKTTKQITEWQRVKMTPDRDKTELAYQYYLPKAHKVNRISQYEHKQQQQQQQHIYVCVIIRFYVGRHATSTHHEHETCCHNTYLDVSGSNHSTVVR
jgi:hypothetical protein